MRSTTEQRVATPHTEEGKTVTNRKQGRGAAIAGGAPNADPPQTEETRNLPDDPEARMEERERTLGYAFAVIRTTAELGGGLRAATQHAKQTCEGLRIAPTWQHVSWADLAVQLQKLADDVEADGAAEFVKRIRAVAERSERLSVRPGR